MEGSFVILKWRYLIHKGIGRHFKTLRAHTWFFPHYPPPANPVTPRCRITLLDQQVVGAWTLWDSGVAAAHEYTRLHPTPARGFPSVSDPWGGKQDKICFWGRGHASPASAADRQRRNGRLRCFGTKRGATWAKARDPGADNGEKETDSWRQGQDWERGAHCL